MFTAIIGYSTALVGFMTGALLTRLTERADNRVRNVLTGSAAGIVLAFVVLEMLPQVFSDNGAVIGITLVFAGTLVAALFEERSANAAAVFTIGILLHGLPEGMAFGSILNSDPAAGIVFALTLSVHCLSESLTLFGYATRDDRRLLTTAAVLAIPFGIGAALGAELFVGASASLCLAFAGGIMIYLACSGILPDRANGCIAAVCAALGFTAWTLIM